MGICNTKSRKQQGNTILMQNNTSFEEIDFYFSTQSIQWTNSNCLVLFVDDTCDVAHNQSLQKAGKGIVVQVKRYLQARLLKQQKTLKQGDCFIFEGTNKLRFKYISVLCLPVWSKHSKALQCLQKALKDCMQRLVQLHAQSFTICEIGFQLGYPPNIIAEQLMEAIYSNRSIKRGKIEQVFVIFSDENHQNIYMQTLKNFRKQRNKSQINENDSFKSSVYF